MASSLALKRLVCSNILPSSMRVLRPTTVAPYTSRLFNTNAIREFNDDGDERDLDDESRTVRSLSRRGDGFFPDVFDPFSPTRSLSQVLNMMDQFMDNPLLSASRGMGGGIRRNWDAKETEDSLNLRIDMPGLGKEDVKISVEQNTLIIMGEGAKESEDEVNAGRYTSRIHLPEKIYKTDQIKADMKNGVLKVVVPKIKEEERNDVIQVRID
ncbi:23.6 kDa heat shock protein, mitochondrial-like [Durio zibethinus]|uniref:23.6 kDa heat shock protein, mitochondrial-like n=1 Tax=Durio zibethinus TaxID=66656 RepID=A0A6P5Y8I5_DURZI|nr:23.6 kDa heat shock protein, mitochondrial-like [Durio zibethinus]